MCNKFNIILLVLLAFFISCSIASDSKDVNSENIDQIFKLNVTGNYRTVVADLLLNNIVFTLISNQNIKLSPDNLNITVEADDGTILIFMIKKINNTNSATYSYNNIDVTFCIDIDKNIRINNIIIANRINDQISNSFKDTIKGGYVSTSGIISRNEKYLDLNLDEHNYSLIDDTLKIKLIKQDGTPFSLIFLQEIDSSNAIYLLENTEDDILVKIVKNGDIFINDIRVLRKIQNNSVNFASLHKKIFVTKEAVVNLDGQNIVITKNNIIFFDINNDLIFPTTQGNLVLNFERAVHQDEAIFNYQYNEVIDKQNLIVDGLNLLLDGKIIAQKPNPVIENSFKKNISYSSYATVRVDNFVVDSWDTPAFNLIDGNIFKIDNNNLNINLKTDSGEMIWVYNCAYSPTEAIYNYNGKYITIVVDTNLRHIKTSVNAKQTIIAKDVKDYFIDLFTTAFTSEQLTIIQPKFTMNNIFYQLPLLSFTPTDKDLNISDNNNNILKMVFVEIIDPYTAKYNITTKTGTVNNVLVKYINQELFINDQKIAVQSEMLTLFQMNYIGRYTYNAYPSNKNSYGYIHPKNGLTLFIDFNKGYTGIFQVDSISTSKPNTHAKFNYQIFYQENLLSLDQNIPDDLPIQIQELLLSNNQTKNSDLNLLDLFYKKSDSTIYISNDNSILLVKINPN